MAWSRLMRVVLWPAAVRAGSRKSTSAAANNRKIRERIRVNQVALKPWPRDTGEVSPNLRPGSSLVTALLAVGNATRAPGGHCKRITASKGDKQTFRCTLRPPMSHRSPTLFGSRSPKSAADWAVEWPRALPNTWGARRIIARAMMHFVSGRIRCLPRDTPAALPLAEKPAPPLGFRFGAYRALQFARPDSRFIVHYPG